MEERRFVFHPENLLSPRDAIATFLARVPLAPLGIERVPLEDAAGRVLAQALHADRDYPDAPRSAMDGFAVRAAQTPGRMRVDGEIAMGRAWPAPLASGAALRIPTGGVVPEGADAVVPVEDASLEGAEVVVGGVHVGENVNPRACDMRAGQPVLAAGTRIGGAQLGVLATLGVTEVPVFRRPSIAVISSGDELVPPGATPEPGQIRDSNRYAIAGTLLAMGARPVNFPTVTDEPGKLEAVLRQALEHCDAAVLTGGSSVGERDRTPDAIASLGAPGVVVHGLRVKPGKPTVLAAVGHKLVLGLPGNPTSALMILSAVAAPLMEALCGGALPNRKVSAVLASPLHSRKGWTWFVPVQLKDEPEGPAAHPLPLRSSTVSALARADGYVAVPEEQETLEAGARVIVHRLM